MTVTDAQALAIAKRVIEMLKALRVVLKKAGLDVDLMVSTLTTLLEVAAATEASQEAMKRQTKATTDSWLKIKKQMYTTASGYLDMAIAAVGKDTSEAKNLRMVRSRVNRPDKDEEPVSTPTG
jgi:hypothetical protein